ncbi:hypothetical protein SH528x_000851 [Novipirellula sp. SH528]|uniref:hypothetical protein n=1 Tax=Novipirellula sp. SH528 TaxID=3454466 RepID=UPI003FA051AA
MPILLARRFVFLPNGLMMNISNRLRSIATMSLGVALSLASASSIVAQSPRYHDESLYYQGSEIVDNEFPEHYTYEHEYASEHTSEHASETGHGEFHTSHHGICLDPGHPRKPKHEQPGDVNRGDCPPKRYRMDDCVRAGNPHCVAPWAKCSPNKKYSAWYVGGGAAFSKIPDLHPGLLHRGRDRETNAYHGHGEGTWGMDYSGLFGHANVWLKYTHDRKQGGEGEYRTDGEPKVIARAKSILKHVHEQF